ncbi:type II secretion system protein N [uncultured Paraglaciecola sp.]|uniref:type II secretion system protein N n=1 Tax=uncultured Paraglaciecola sp. TaxID=1765024 RepID=UPI0026213627|nr:type II secretion system protein N [uncultured Paraglaciecola sp.]
MKSALKWSSLGLLVYVVFLIAKLPAVHVISNIQLPAGVNVGGISGSIWNGQMQRAQANGLPISNLSWQLSFFPLLIGEVSADIKAGNVRDIEQISANGHVSVSSQGIQAEDVVAYVPTDLVVSMLTLPVPVQAGGRLKVQLNELSYKAGCQTALGKGQWLNANYTGTAGTIDLGNFDADLGCQKGNIVVDVKQPNSFGLTAKALIPANLNFKVEGRFKPNANLPKEVHQAAQFFGKTDANGYYPIKF